jgi:hypothetical protein
LSNADHIILLFNLASTPEPENHGALVDQLRTRLADRSELSVLIDDSAFTHKLRGQASAPRRVDERLQAWRAVLAASRAEPIRVTLDGTAIPMPHAPSNRPCCTARQPDEQRGVAV